MARLAIVPVNTRFVDAVVCLAHLPTSSYNADVVEAPLELLQDFLHREQVNDRELDGIVFATPNREDIARIGAAITALKSDPDTHHIPYILVIGNNAFDDVQKIDYPAVCQPQLDMTKRRVTDPAPS